MQILLLIVSPIVAPIALLCVGFKVWVDFFSAKLLESITATFDEEETPQ